MGYCRFRTWSPRLVITTAAIVTGVVGAPIARADTGADLGVPSQAGRRGRSALADAAAVPAVTLSENPVPAVPLLPESLPPVAPAAEEALQPVMPNEGSAPVASSQAEPAPSGERRGRSGPAAGESDRPERRGRPAAPGKPTVPGARAGDSAVAPDPPPDSTPGERELGRYHRSRADDERATPGKQPTRAIQLGPVNIQISIRVASPGDNGAVTQVNAVVTAATGSAAPPGSPATGAPDDHTDHADTVGSPGESRDIGRDITGSTIGGSTDDRAQDPTCDPRTEGCCSVSLLAGVCLNTDAGELSPIDITRILDAIFGNASDNADVSAQYQGDAVQYRPVNISVSIRISSPGNDGPVEQTNLVRVQASISVEVAQAVQPLAGPLDPTIGVAITVDIAPADGEVAQQEPVARGWRGRVGRFRPSRYRDAHDEYPRSHAARFAVFALVRPGITERDCDITARMGCRPAPVARVDHSDLPASRGRPATTRRGRPPLRPHNAGRPAPPPHRLPRRARGLPVELSVAPASASSRVVATVVGSRSRSRFRSCSPSSIPASRRLRTSASVPSAHITRRARAARVSVSS